MLLLVQYINNINYLEYNITIRKGVIKIKKIKRLLQITFVLIALFSLFGCLNNNIDKIFPDVNQLEFSSAKYHLKFYTNNFYINFKKITPYETNGIINVSSSSKTINATIKKNRVYIDFILTDNLEDKEVILTFTNKNAKVVATLQLIIYTNKDILAEQITLLRSKLKEVSKTSFDDPKLNRFDRSFLIDTKYDKYEQNIKDAQLVYKNNDSTQIAINKEVIKLKQDIKEFEDSVFQGEKIIEPTNKEKMITGLSFGGFLALSLLIIFLVFYFFNRKKIKKANQNE